MKTLFPSVFLRIRRIIDIRRPRSGRLFFLYLILAACFRPGPVFCESISEAIPNRESDDRGRELAPRDSLAEALELMHQGQLTRARSLCRRLIRDHPVDPWARLVEVRVARESLSDQHGEKKRISRGAAPLIGRLDDAKKLIEAQIDSDDPSPESLLLRGWIDMDRAHLYALSKEFWSAAKAAKSGKGDLERCLELDPDNTDAKGVLGIYLYFADSLPSFFKILRTLLFIPGGDRELGLAYLRESSLGQGLVSRDSQLFLAAILVGFEGRLEDGFDEFRAIREIYPQNPRYVEPLGLAAIFLTDRRESALADLDQGLELCRRSREAFHREVAFRLLYYRGLIRILSGRVKDGMGDLETIVDLAPSSPDWILPAAARHLLSLLAWKGESVDADRILAWLARITDFDQEAEEIRGEFDKWVEQIEERAGAGSGGVFQNTEKGAVMRFSAHRAGVLKEAASARERGDMEKFRSLLEDAVSRPPVPSHDLAWFQASLDLSWEMWLEGEAGPAREWVIRAKEAYQVEDLLGVVFDARRSFIERFGETR